MNRLPLSFFVLFFIIYSACRVTKSKDGLKGVETSYLDSFEVRLPYYVINSKMIEEKLDSIILFVESCDEYQRNGKDYPTFLYLSTIDTGIKLIEIKASRNHVSLLDPDGFFKPPFSNENYIGVAIYRGYKVFLSDLINLSLSKEPILLPFLSATRDTLSFVAIGLRKTSTKEWRLQLDLPLVIASYKLCDTNLVYIDWICYPNVKFPWPCGHPVTR